MTRWMCGFILSEFLTWISKKKFLKKCNTAKFPECTTKSGRVILNKNGFLYLEFWNIWKWPVADHLTYHFCKFRLKTIRSYLNIKIVKICGQISNLNSTLIRTLSSWYVKLDWSVLKVNFMSVKVVPVSIGIFKIIYIVTQVLSLYF